MNEAKKETFGRKEKIVSVALVLLLVMTGVWAIFSVGPDVGASLETGSVQMSDLVNSKSVRSKAVPQDAAVVASSASPFYALIGTPASVAWSKNGQKSTTLPLLVADKEAPSSAVTSFLALYGSPSIVAIGDVGAGEYIGASRVVQRLDGWESEDVSAKAALYFWNASDGAMLIKNGDNGYSIGVSAAAAASYLDIPVIVADRLSVTVISALKKLNVKYTITVGEINGYGLTRKINSAEDAQALTLELIRQRLGSAPAYVAVANPLDTYKRVTLESQARNYSGDISDTGAAEYPGAAPTSANGPMHNFAIPADYQYANVVLDVLMDVSDAKGAAGIGNDADASGERIYAYVGTDKNGDKQLGDDETIFFGGSPAYGYIRDGAEGRPLYAWYHTEIPFVNDNGKNFTIQLMAKLPTYYPTYTSTYSVNIVIEKLASATYPLMPGLSSLASYLAAYRKGVVLAKPEYQVHSNPGVSCASCGIPSSSPSGLGLANNKSIEIKNDLNTLLGKLVNASVKKADTWTTLVTAIDKIDVDARPHIGIIADTNMVPQYYFKTNQGGGSEGYGMPSDNVYMDVDMDPANAPKDLGGGDPTFELAAGRVDGWDAQDVSALLGRTFFYNDIIDSHQGPENGGLSPEWKDSVMTTVGTEMPVTASRVTAEKLTAMFERAGFSVDNDNNFERSRRQFSQGTYESSNFIYFAVHGFYYWYSPTAWEGKYGILPKTSGGGSFDVSHVKEMSFGPSVIYGLSCVTGRIDGLQPYNTISMAFLHAGMNAYIGASRSAWGAGIPIPDKTSGEELGDLLGMYFYGALTGYTYDKHGGLLTKSDMEDATTGVALMHAKNLFVKSEGTDNGGSTDDTYNQFILHGDPAFNPYEPNHEGSAAALLNLAL